MRSWKGSKRDRAQRRRSMRKLMEHYGTDNPHEATKHLFEDMAAEVRRKARRLKHRQRHQK